LCIRPELGFCSIALHERLGFSPDPFELLPMKMMDMNSMMNKATADVRMILVLP